MGETLEGALQDIAAGLDFLHLHEKAQFLKTLAYTLGHAEIDDEDDLRKVIRQAEAYQQQKTAVKEG